MIYTAEIPDIDKDENDAGSSQWSDFEKTGSIEAYLKYKGISLPEEKNTSEL